MIAFATSAVKLCAFVWFSSHRMRRDRAPARVHQAVQRRAHPRVGAPLWQASTDAYLAELGIAAVDASVFGSLPDGSPSGKTSFRCGSPHWEDKLPTGFLRGKQSQRDRLPGRQLPPGPLTGKTSSHRVPYREDNPTGSPTGEDNPTGVPSGDEGAHRGSLWGGQLPPRVPLRARQFPPGIPSGEYCSGGDDGVGTAFGALADDAAAAGGAVDQQ
jgi:hypothetical protein